MLAQQAAIVSPQISSHMIGTKEFPELSKSYGLTGVVPRTVINDAVYFEGIAPESVFVTKIQEVVFDACENGPNHYLSNFKFIH